jgi:hypothetical protein
MVLILFFAQVEFPAVTFCAPGITDENMEAGFYQLILDFLDANKMHIEDVNPYNASPLLQKVILSYFLRKA